jgi:hypothetical protein
MMIGSEIGWSRAFAELPGQIPAIRVFYDYGGIWGRVRAATAIP